MANELRVRLNAISGVITDNPLAIGATTLNSPGLADLPVIDATNHMVLILDPQEVGGPAEIVYVTAHTAAATTATILRAQDGSVARSHVFNTTWQHGPVASDFSKAFADSARGQLGYAQAIVNQGGITSGTDLTGLSVVASIGTNRRIKITGNADSWTSTVASDRAVFRIMEDGVEVGRVIGLTEPVPGNAAGGGQVVCVRTPTAGNHTYKLQADSADGGTITMQAGSTRAAFILVEDIGAV